MSKSRFFTILPIGLLLLLSCGSSISWRPTVYIHDYEQRQIINANNKIVSCGDKEFNNYVSISLEDLAEIIHIVGTAKMPSKLKKKMLKEGKKIKKRADKQAL